MVLEIPERTSSKSTRVELETKREEINKEVKRMRNALKPQAFFNSAYAYISLFF